MFMMFDITSGGTDRAELAEQLQPVAWLNCELLELNSMFSGLQRRASISHLAFALLSSNVFLQASKCSQHRTW
jgi:hypothetical protein